MDISVIIVNYNVKYFLDQCIQSVLNSIKNLSVEIIVVDNNSVDGSCSHIRKKFPQVTLIENKVNTGFSKANNQGINISKGNYILLLNPDTVIEESTLTKCFNFMEEHTDAGGLGVKMIDGKGNFLPESKRGLPSPRVAFFKTFGLSRLFPKSGFFNHYHLGYLSKDKTNPVEILAGAFMFLRKEILDKVGYLDENFFMYGEDIDLSYRIIKAGFKNYYFPETTIIHYKGESTKKSSINYVLVFYNAMIIFARKHFSKQKAGLYTVLIKLAIYFRATLSIFRRLYSQMLIPLADAVTIYFGFLFIIKPVWEHLKFGGNINYPKEYSLLVFPIYLIIWLFFIYFFGGYEKPVKSKRAVRGIIAGTFAILILYALAPENLRFSRAIIILSTLWCLAGIYLVRSLFYLINSREFSVEFRKRKRRIIILGDYEEAQRVCSILSEVDINPDMVGFINPNPAIHDINSDYLGSVDQIKDIIKINNADELIFCAKSITSEGIIHCMLQLSDYPVEFKIASAGGVSIIGSNSIDTAGEFYEVNLNIIGKEINKRKKRMLDILLAIFFTIISPIALFFMKNPLGYLLNVILVFATSKSWVGYVYKDGVNNFDLPVIKPGVLNPLFSLKNNVDDIHVIEKINTIYAKEYSILIDLEIIFKGFRFLGNK